MAANKEDLLNALGKVEDSAEIKILIDHVDGSFVKEEGVMPQQIYVECDSKGISLSFQPIVDDGAVILTAIHLTLDSRDGMGVYEGWMGGDALSRKISIENIKDLYGVPIKQGGGEIGFMGRVTPYWLRYDYDEYIIHFEFSDDKKEIGLITIMYPDAAP